MDLCTSTLRVWFPSGGITSVQSMPASVTQNDDTHLTYRCTRRADHDGDHGWCQGFDTDWTYRWSAT